MSFVCIVDVTRAATFGEAFEQMPAAAQAFVLERFGPRTGYRVEQHFPDEMPGCIMGKPVSTLEEAKTQAEKRYSKQGERVYWGQPTAEENAQAAGIVCVLRAETWELWHKDLFDLTSAAEIQATGTGLMDGLTELWASYLDEGVHGLSRFSLSCLGQQQEIEVAGGDLESMYTLRRWIYGVKDRYQQVDRKAANASVLGSLAATHAKLILTGRPLTPILDLARTATDVSDFVLGLSALEE